ncbi:MAG: T9SS type A sorting domain-containing protein [Ignavibacteriae bacterium]|nr:T9SS type A sorting domain-containing protein [Ignavibacteriota bacterium]
MKVKLIILFSFLSNLCFSQQGWILQSTGTDDSLRSVKFINYHTGWAAGTNGTIIKTTDSGNSWNIIFSGINADLNSLSPAISVSDTTLFISGDSGIMIKSTDLGNSWSQLTTGTKENLNSIFFINSVTGWSCGNNGKIIKTTDSGNNWSDLNSSTDIQLNSIFFTDQNIGWTAGFGGIFNTNDGGQNWSPQFIDGYLVLRSIFFTDPFHGWAAYYDNQIFGPENTRTTDGGLSWINYSMNNSYSISINFYNSMTGWSSGFYGRINHSTDGGVSWTNQISNTDEHLNSVFFLDSINGWIAGNSGVMLKTTNAGILTGFTNQSDYIGKYSLTQNYPNPFNPTTNLEFGISELGFVSLKVYDISGKEVATLLNEVKPAGNYVVNFNGANLSSGIYFYTVKSGDFISTKRMILLK